MYNKAKIRLSLVLFGLVVVGFIGMIGYTLGSQLSQNEALKNAEKQATIVLEEKTKELEDKTLSEDKVKEFLIQYYTKKKLGENNNRIQQYMTDAAYNTELANQELATNQVNKDFIVDYVFDSATIFINSSTKEVIAEVTYSLTYLSEVKNGQQYKTTSKQTETVKLAYYELSNQLLVNQMTLWNNISLSNLTDGGASFLENYSSSSQSTFAADESSSPIPESRPSVVIDESSDI